MITGNQNPALHDMFIITLYSLNVTYQQIALGMKRNPTNISDSDLVSKFWVDTFNKSSIVDWDVFIIAFSSFIQKNFKIKLEEIQRNQIKRIVDPSNQQEIKIKNFNDFLEDYWVLPINREKLFKKHFKAVDTEYQNGFKGVQFTITSKQIGKEAPKTVVYTFRNDVIKCNNVTHALKNKGFVNIGSSQQADISINNLYVNPIHFKIFKHPLGYKIKDVSKSNRARLRISKPLLLKPGMVINIFKYEIQILNLRLTQINEGDYLNVAIYEQPTQQIQDSTFTFIVKNTDNQEQKKYSINYKKIFRIGKDSQCDAVLDDIRCGMVSCLLLFNRQNWFIQPKQDIELYMATRSQLKEHCDSLSLFAETGMRVQFKDTMIDIKMIKN